MMIYILLLKMRCNVKNRSCFLISSRTKLLGMTNQSWPLGSFTSLSSSLGCSVGLEGISIPN
jgi:hypothetical protein